MGQVSPESLRRQRGLFLRVTVQELFVSDPGDHIALANGGLVLPGEVVDQKHLL